MRFTATVLCAALLGAPLSSARALAAIAADEEVETLRTAETAMVSGQYEKALPLYAKLFGETHNPVYLRNLGRCHQFLKHADEAILNFRQYLNLNTAKISESEKSEVQGFIDEMETLKRRQASDDRGKAQPAAEAGPSVAVRSAPAGDASPASSEAALGEWRKPAAYGVAGLGLVGVVVGGGLALSGASKANDAIDRYTRMPTPDVYQKAKSDYDKAQSRNQTGLIVAGLGAAILGGGIALWATAPEDRTTNRASVAPFLVGQSPGLLVEGSW
jgi:tetratricopeptide (TPR) repeat protein